MSRTRCCRGPASTFSPRSTSSGPACEPPPLIGESLPGASPRRLHIAQLHNGICTRPPTPPPPRTARHGICTALATRSAHHQEQQTVKSPARAPTFSPRPREREMKPDPRILRQLLPRRLQPRQRPPGIPARSQDHHPHRGHHLGIRRLIELQIPHQLHRPLARSRVGPVLRQQARELRCRRQIIQLRCDSRLVGTDRRLPVADQHGRAAPEGMELRVGGKPRQSLCGHRHRVACAVDAQVEVRDRAVRGWCVGVDQEPADGRLGLRWAGRLERCLGGDRQRIGEPRVALDQSEEPLQRVLGAILPRPDRDQVGDGAVRARRDRERRQQGLFGEEQIALALRGNSLQPGADHGSRVAIPRGARDPNRGRPVPLARFGGEVPDGDAQISGPVLGPLRRTLARGRLRD